MLYDINSGDGLLTIPLGVNRSGYVVGQYGPGFQDLKRGFF